jgi:hypothetical protein
MARTQVGGASCNCMYSCQPCSHDVSFELCLCLCVCVTIEKLLSGISLDYARLLARLGFQQGAEHYCRVAGGDEGKELLDKITTAFSAKS